MKVIVVTGAAGAIGAAITRALAAKHPDAHLALVDLAAPAVAAELGARASTWRWDLSRPDELEARWAALTDAHGAPDVLVNCAGIMDVRSLTGMPWAAGQRVLDVDFTSPMRLMHLAAPAMIARGAGAIVNVSSMAGRVPLRGCTFYGGAKAGMAMASEIAHLELAPAGVRVVTVYPGPVASALEAGARAQLPPTLLSRVLPTGDARAIAAMIVRAIDRGEPRVVYPALYALADRAIGVASWVTRRFSPAPLH
jgi:NAD(P)-dependent dehydrogenase (short-subunit alcohol dehydrogenase family)